MGDESLGSAENFENSVSFATLESRPETPSFDTKSDERGGGRQWERDTWLRLEVRPLLGDPKSEPNVFGVDHVVIFGPEDKSGARAMVAYDEFSHQKRNDVIKEAGPHLFIREIIRDGVPVKGETVIHTGDRIRVTQFDPEKVQFGNSRVLEVESMKSGKVED